MRGSGVVLKRNPEPANATPQVVALAILLILGLLAPVGLAAETEPEREGGPLPASLEEAHRLLPENPLFPVQMPGPDPEALTQDPGPAPELEKLRPKEPPQPLRDERGDPPAPLTIPASTHDCRTHPQIVIKEDEGPDGFAVVQDPTTGIAVPRPGSGVTGGTGRPVDPYVIEGWCIGPTPFIGSGSAGILIQDTDAHVVIRENTLAGYWTMGIRLEGANNVTVENNRLLSLDTAVWAERGEDLVFRGNVVEDSWDLAFFLEETKRATIEDNTMRDDFYGIYGSGNEDLEVLTNDVRSLWQPVLLYDTTGGAFHGNSFQGPHGVILMGVERLFFNHNTFGHSTGLYVRDSEGVGALYNSFSSNTYFAIEAVNHSNMTLSHNTLQGSGVLAYNGQGLRVDFNDFEGPLSYGLVIRGTDDAMVERNSFRDSWNAVTLIQSDVHFRQNSLEGNTMGVWGSLSGDQDIIFRDNTVRGGNYAVALSGGGHLETSRNRIEDHNIMGFYATSFTSADIQDNEIHSNGISGIQMSGTPNTTIKENEISGHNAIGVIVNYPIGEPRRPLAHIAEDDGVHPDDHEGGDPGEPDVPQGIIRIEDNILNDNGYGILARYGEVHVRGNQLLSHDGQGITVTNALLGAVSDNEVALGDSARIFVGDSRHMDITGNTLYSGSDQIVLRASTDLTVRDNTLYTGGIVLDGEKRPHYIHTIDDSNTVGGHPIVYVKDEEDVQITGTPAQVILVGAHRATINGLAFDGGIMPLVVVASDDVKVTNSTFTRGELGILALQSDRLRLTGNTFEDHWVGTLLFDTVDAELDENGYTQTFFALAALQTHNLQISGISVKDTFTGILLQDSVGTRIGPGTLETGSGIAMDVWTSRDVEIEGLGITGFPVGIKLGSSRGTLLENSILEGNGEGIRFEGSRGAEVQGNEITRNDIGLRLDDMDGGDHIVQGNNIHMNHVHGVESDSPFSLDARENWWGCPQGPGSGDCDTVEGDVDTDPWRTEPVPDAGP